MNVEQMTPTHVRERIIEIVSDWTDGKIEVPEDASALLLIADYVDSLHESLRTSIPKPVVEVKDFGMGLGDSVTINGDLVFTCRDAELIAERVRVALGMEGGGDE